MGQSRVSYHMRKLKEAGLVREERRGRWSFYSLDREAARDLLADTGSTCGVATRSMNVLMVGVEGILRSGLSDDFAEQLRGEHQAGGGGVEGR